ncbi:SDR family NAD(P)-dependent oxidoreductase [Actinomadura sp. LD22]|uniref:SDR family NAD(P)-dependent oxidoreductase n=1 Tax=Actinomadura physcomitrii TaxID=2650748 RepID=A0A6I4MLC9_9ACTN|nr:SDR family NAD(P)-dependent oxidoreductase [Actinomadura physcomitrii]MWA07028.1 SDR family NAD(P)-dependent oxidoreductase [Actinomadura physcomitrii]
MRDLKGKVAVVTGAAEGIGAGIARALAAHGAHVVIADINAQGAEALADELAAADVRTLGLHCDVSDRTAVEALADQAFDAFGHVDIVVNNAGVLPPIKRVVDIDERDARWVLEVNVLGVLHGCSVFGRRFVEQGSPAHILNTGSENSLGLPHTGAGMYTASKHAVLGLSDVLRNELPDHIGVSVLCPGMVATRLAGNVRNRPERFGGAITPARDGAQHGMDPDEVGRRAVEGIRRGDFYIVTHPPVIELAKERWLEISAAFAAQAPRFEGDESLDTRAQIRRLRRPSATNPG